VVHWHLNRSQLCGTTVVQSVAYKYEKVNLMKQDEAVKMAKKIMNLIEMTRGRGNTSFLQDSINRFPYLRGQTNNPMLIVPKLFNVTIIPYSFVCTIDQATKSFDHKQFPVFDNSVIYELCRLICDDEYSEDEADRDADKCVEIELPGIFGRRPVKVKFTGITDSSKIKITRI